MEAKSYAIRLPEAGEFYRFMTTIDDWEAIAKGLPGEQYQSDTPVSLCYDEARAFADWSDEVVGESVEVVEVVGPPTHRFADDPHPTLRHFFPQLKRMLYRCPETLELFETNDAQSGREE